FCFRCHFVRARIIRLIEPRCSRICQIPERTDGSKGVFKAGQGSCGCVTKKGVRDPTQEGSMIPSLPLRVLTRRLLASQITVRAINAPVESIMLSCIDAVRDGTKL